MQKHRTPPSGGEYCSFFLIDRLGSLTILDDFHKTLEMRQHGAAHQDGDLLADLDTGVTSLPRLLTATDGLQEGKQRRDSKSGGDHGKRSAKQGA